jgi:hypothetical protein
MTEQVYKDLLEVMKSRRGRYAGMDIPEFFELVEVLFTPQEAEVNNALKPKPATAGDVAKEMGRNENDIAGILDTMADKGLCKTFVRNGARLFQGVPFIPGIFEYQFMDGKTTGRQKQIAGLIQAYEQAYEAAEGETKMTFPTSRVITVDRSMTRSQPISISTKPLQWAPVTVAMRLNYVTKMCMECHRTSVCGLATWQNISSNVWGSGGYPNRRPWMC